MSELVPNMALVGWEFRRDGLEGSIARNLQSSGVERERAFELAGQIVDDIENLEHIQGTCTSFSTPAPHAEEIELKFQLSGVVKVRL